LSEEEEEEGIDSDVKMDEIHSLDQFKIKTPFDPQLYLKVLSIYDFLYQYNTVMNLPLMSTNLVHLL